MAERKPSPSRLERSSAGAKTLKALSRVISFTATSIDSVTTTGATAGSFWAIRLAQSYQSPHKPNHFLLETPGNGSARSSKSRSGAPRWFT